MCKYFVLCVNIFFSLVFFGLMKNVIRFAVMETPELPLKWPEKLKALDVGQGLPVDNTNTVYAAIRALKESDDPEIRARNFTIRIGYVYRLANN